jgi:hypothetical protein
LEKELEILEEEIDAMAALKESLQNKEAHKKSKTHDESDVTIKVTYPKEVFLPPSEWNWNLIVQSIYPACDAELVCWTIPHPSGPTW